MVLPGSGHDRAQQLRALLAAAALEPRLRRVMRAAPGRVGQLALELRAVVEQRVVPGARRDALARGLVDRGRDERHQLAVGDAVAVGEQLVQEDRPHVRLEVDAGQLERERAHAGRGGRPDAGQRPQRGLVARQLATEPLDDLLGGALERDGPAVVAEALPRAQHRLERRGGERVERRELARATPPTWAPRAGPASAAASPRRAAPRTGSRVLRHGWSR